jgi:ABC-type antimicrobial peptide transport system permease subunit
MTYTTIRRTGEIGIRVALGASCGQITGMVLRETLLLVLLGRAIGIPAATASSHLVGSELYGLRAGDPVTILIAVSLWRASLPLRVISPLGEPLTWTRC